MNADGDLIIDYTDGREENAGHVAGGGTGSWQLSVNGETETIDETNNTVTLNGGSNIEITKTAAGTYEMNLSASPSTQNLTIADTLAVAGNTEINASGVSTNAVRVNTAAGEVVINNDGVSMGGNVISNVAPGVAPTDAATVGQLTESTDNLYRAYSELSDEIEDLGAETAALAGLKPIQYDPLEPTQIMAAVGAYRGSGAIAVGIAHYMRENVMFHMGASYGGTSHRVLANAGVTFRVGAKKTGIPDRYKAGPISATYVMQDEITALKAENEKLRGNIDKLEDRNDKQQERIGELENRNDKLQENVEELKAQVRMLMEAVGKK